MLKRERDMGHTIYVYHHRESVGAPERTIYIHREISRDIYRHTESHITRGDIYGACVFVRERKREIAVEIPP